MPFRGKHITIPHKNDSKTATRSTTLPEALFQAKFNQQRMCWQSTQLRLPLPLVHTSQAKSVSCISFPISLSPRHPDIKIQVMSFNRNHINIPNKKVPKTITRSINTSKNIISSKIQNKKNTPGNRPNSDYYFHYQSHFLKAKSIFFMTTISSTTHISSKQIPFSSFYIQYQIGRLPSKFNSRPSNERTSPKLSQGPLPRWETLFGSRIQQTKNTPPVLDCTHTTTSTTSLPLTFFRSKQNPFPARIVSHHLNFYKSKFIPPHFIPNKRVPIYYHH